MCSTFLLSPNALQIQIRCSRNLFLLSGVYTRSKRLAEKTKSSSPLISILAGRQRDPNWNDFKNVRFQKTYAFYCRCRFPVYSNSYIGVCWPRVDAVAMEFRSMSENKNVGVASIEDAKKNPRRFTDT